MLDQVGPLNTPLPGRPLTTEGIANGRLGLLRSRGKCRPFGATPTPDGVNFAVFSRHAQSLTLLLFEEGREEPFAEIPLDATQNKTGDIWHVFVHNLARRGAVRLTAPMALLPRGRDIASTRGPPCRSVCPGDQRADTPGEHAAMGAIALLGWVGSSSMTSTGKATFRPRRRCHTR